MKNIYILVFFAILSSCKENNSKQIALNTKISGNNQVKEAFYDFFESIKLDDFQKLENLLLGEKEIDKLYEKYKSENNAVNKTEFYNSFDKLRISNTVNYLKELKNDIDNVNPNDWKKANLESIYFFEDYNNMVGKVALGFEIGNICYGLDAFYWNIDNGTYCYAPPKVSNGINCKEVQNEMNKLKEKGGVEYENFIKNYIEY